MQQPPTSPQRIFAVGDIHGHADELRTLYQRMRDAGLEPETDTVVFLGDYVDGGPQTRDVVSQLIAWQEQYPHWVFLKGNHEDLMLDALVYHGRTYGDFYLWWNQGGRETARSYLPQEGYSDYERAIMQPEHYIATDHLEWLNRLPLTHETGSFHFVHAGFRPRRRLDAQTPEDLLWIREAFFASGHNFGKPVVFGHTPFVEPVVIRDLRPGHTHEIIAIGIDTMLHNAGFLTAVRLDPEHPHADPLFISTPSHPG
jgi:serine/threonine protein phosphatase 1